MTVAAPSNALSLRHAFICPSDIQHNTSNTIGQFGVREHSESENSHGQLVASAAEEFEELRRQLYNRAEHTGQLAQFEKHLASPAGKEMLAQLVPLRTMLDRPRGPIRLTQPAFRAGAETFVTLLRTHPSFREGHGVGRRSSSVR